MDIKQKKRFSDKELELIKNTFGGDEGEKKIYEIRDVFLQFSDESPAFSLEVFNIIRKLMLPDLDPEVPLDLQQDNYETLEYIKGMTPEYGFDIIRSRDLAVRYLEQRMDVLMGQVIISGINLKELRYSNNDNERFVNLIAYLDLVKTINTNLMSLKGMANQKEETEEEKKSRLKKDSTK